MRTRDITRFQSKVYTHYKRHGRDLPWRRTSDPYHILVSEIMLQQTQIDRVIPKYQLFLETFPTLEALAQAPLASVLRVWQGLGYNRRARMLHSCAQVVVSQYGGIFPQTHAELVQLPGIGHYTAGAILAFAFNTPVPIIETNIRTVYLHHFFADRTDVPDSLLMPYIDETLDRDNPRGWYAALMSYGVHLKKTVGNANVRSRHYVRQSRFEGSARQVRGCIVRVLSAHDRPLSLAALTKACTYGGVETQLEALAREGLVRKEGRGYVLGN